MSKESRKKLFRELKKEANYKQKTMTAKEIARMLENE